MPPAYAVNGLHAGSEYCHAGFLLQGDEGLLGETTSIAPEQNAWVSGFRV